MIVVVMATSTHSQGWDLSTDYLRLVSNPHMHRAIHLSVAAESAETGLSELRTHTRSAIFGRPESLPADSAAQHRSVPEVNSALAAASHRTMGAQPPCVLRFRT